MQIRYNYFIKQLFSAKCFLERSSLEIPIKQNPASRILRLRLVASSDIQRMFEKGFPLQCERVTVKVLDSYLY